MNLIVLQRSGILEFFHQTLNNFCIFTVLDKKKTKTKTKKTLTSFVGHLWFDERPKLVQNSSAPVSVISLGLVGARHRH